jgi:hypothetical protein
MTAVPNSLSTAPAPAEPAAAPSDENAAGGLHGKNALRGAKKAHGKHHRKKH